MFIEFCKQKSRKVNFGDDGRGNIFGIGKNSANSIGNANLVDGLKYYLLSISQLYDKDNHVWFNES